MGKAVGVSRELDVLFMLRGLRQKIRAVRDDIDDYPVEVRARLWKSEMHVAEAEKLVVPPGAFVEPVEPPTVTKADPSSEKP